MSFTDYTLRTVSLLLLASRAALIVFPSLQYGWGLDASMLMLWCAGMAPVHSVCGFQSRGGPVSLLLLFVPAALAAVPALQYGWAAAAHV